MSPILRCCLLLVFLPTITSLLITEKPRSCRHGWLSWRNTCFMFSADQETWANAELRCRALGGYLAEIHDAETNTFIKNHLKVLHFRGTSLVHYFNGLTEVAKPGTWEWAQSRTLPDFTDWYPGEPNHGNHNTQHCCAYASKGAFTWVDISCDAKLSFVCQEDPL